MSQQSIKDASKDERVAGMFALAGKAYGKVDILVNNAGISKLTLLEQIL